MQDAQAAGVTEQRLRASDLDSPFPGVRTPAGTEPTFLDLCDARQVRMDADQFYCHGTAARIHRLTLPRRLEGNDLHVAVLAPGRAPRGAGIIGHQVTLLGDSFLCIAGGLRAIDPVSTWLQLAADLSVRELIILGDSLVRRQYPISTMDTLRRRVQGNRGQRGQRKVQAALRDVRAGTDSPRETELRLEIVDAGYPEPQVNPKIFDSQAQLIGFGDLVYFEYKVLVEYDGDQHRTDPVQFGRDLTRQQELHDEDWIHLRISKYHWPNRRNVINEHLGRALRSRGWRG